MVKAQEDVVQGANVRNYPLHLPFFPFQSYNNQLSLLRLRLNKSCKRREATGITNVDKDRERHHLRQSQFFMEKE